MHHDLSIENLGVICSIQIQSSTFGTEYIPYNFFTISPFAPTASKKLSEWRHRAAVKSKGPRPGTRLAFCVRTWKATEPPVFEWDCGRCEETLRGVSSGEANRAGREHLLEQHRGALAERYRSTISGEPCQNGCGYQFPRDPADIEGFVCPECGTDNLKFHAGKAVWNAISRQ